MGESSAIIKILRSTYSSGGSLCTLTGAGVEAERAGGVAEAPVAAGKIQRLGPRKLGWGLSDVAVTPSAVWG